MNNILKAIVFIMGVLALPVIFLIAIPFILAAIYKCPEQSTFESKSIEERVNKLVASRKLFNVTQIAKRKPVFYCILGPKSLMVDIERFARKINYTLLPFEPYCGFWSWNGRLLIFFDESLLDVPIPLALVRNPDGSEALCTADLSKNLNIKEYIKKVNNNRGT